MKMANANWMYYNNSWKEKQPMFLPDRGRSSCKITWRKRTEFQEKVFYLYHHWKINCDKKCLWTHFSYNLALSAPIDSLTKWLLYSTWFNLIQELQVFGIFAMQNYGLLFTCSIRIKIWCTRNQHHNKAFMKLWIWQVCDMDNENIFC